MDNAGRETDRYIVMEQQTVKRNKNEVSWGGGEEDEKNICISGGRKWGSGGGYLVWNDPCMKWLLRVSQASLYQ